MLYLIKSGNYFKIGYSEDNKIIVRLKIYRTYCVDFEVLGIKDGDFIDEENYHIILEPKRVKTRTEWFHIDDDFENIKKDFCYNKELADIPNIEIETKYSNNKISYTRILRKYKLYINGINKFLDLELDSNEFKIIDTIYHKLGIILNNGYQYEQKADKLLSNE